MTNWKPHLIREKLASKSKEMGLRLPQMQMLLAQERFLNRLFSIDEGKYFIWKGGSLLIREYSTLKVPRYTVDIDLLLKGIDFNKTLDILKIACLQNFDDGFIFSDITATPMERDTPYGGDRFEIKWSMFGKLQSESLRIDISTGDAVLPIIKKFSELSLVSDTEHDLSAQIYPAEYIFAEKLETIFRFGTGNTRCKDIIDLWGLTQRGLDLADLKQSLKICFNNRQRELSLDRLKEIFEDKYFKTVITRMMDSHFKKLELPSVEIIFNDIYNYIRQHFADG